MNPHRFVARAAFVAVLLAGPRLYAPRTAAADVVPNPVGSYGAGVVTHPIGVAIAPNGDIYVVSQNTQRVERFSRAGTHVGGWGGTGSGPGQFQLPWGIACAPDGSLYVVDAALSRVKHFSAAGVYLGEFGTPGAGNGQLDSPRGVAVDAAGNVYVVDTSNQRVQKFSAAGAYLAQW